MKKLLLLFTMSLLMSCLDKNEFENQNQFQGFFDNEAFSKIIQKDFKIGWSSLSQHFSEDLGMNYFEFPVIFSDNSNSVKGKYRVSFALLVTLKDQNNIEFYAVKFYEEIKNDTDFTKDISFSDTNKFSGLIHVLDKNNKLFFAKKMNDGAALDQHLFYNNDPEESSSNSRMEEDCYTVATHHYTDWYVNGIYTDSWLDYTSYETECSSYFLPDLYLDGGGGGGTYGSSTGGVAYNDCGDPLHGCIYQVEDSPTSLLVISPDKPIANMTNYLECFNANQNAIITMYVDQPKSGYSDAFALTWSGAVIGHTFVSITQGSNTSVFGFYPSTDDTNTSSPPEPSAMGDDSGESFDVSISVTVSGTVLQQILQYAIGRPSNYDLDNYNCSDFGIAIGNLAGLGLPDAYGTWPGGGGSNPGALGQHIRSRTSSGNVTIKKTAGTASSNSKGCLIQID